MKNAAVSSVVLGKEGRRLGPRAFVDGSVTARWQVRRLPHKPLKEVTEGFRGGIFTHLFSPKRTYVHSCSHGVPFLGASSMLLADFTRLPLISRKDAESKSYRSLAVKKGMTLISCSGSVGRIAFARADMDGMITAGDILKVQPNPQAIRPGFLYAFLSSRFGRILVNAGAYGTIIRHLEPQHLADLPVPQVGIDTEVRVHELVEKAAELRVAAQESLKNATEMLLAEMALAETTPDVWHASGPELGFEGRIGVSRSLRASNYSPRVALILEQIRSVPHKTLAEICAKGHLGTGARFKCVDSDPARGVRLIGQKQGFWARPEGRWINPAKAPAGIFAADETVMIASSGTLGEQEIYCRPILVTGNWLQYAYTEHFFRVVSGDARISGAYLFAFFRSEIVFRCLRAMSAGSKQQEIHRDLISRFPVPILSEELRERIATYVRSAFRQRDEADILDDEARSLVERAVEEAN